MSMKSTRTLGLLLLYLLGEISCQELRSLRAFDLSYALNPSDPVFPGLVPFNFTQKFATWKYDEDDRAYFQSLNIFMSSEHFGTHLDAPFHGSNSSWTLTEIPFDRFVSTQGFIVDVSKQSEKVKNYAIKISDLNEKVLQQAKGYFVLLFYTGRSKFWPDQIRYAGGSTRDELDFPGLSAELARHLVEKYSKTLVGVGIDTLSIDPGSSKDFLAHRILFQANIYALENVANLNSVLSYLSRRRETFFALDVLPMKIQGGTGAPCRIVARVEDFDRTGGGGWFVFLIILFLLLLAGILGKAIYDLKFNPNQNF